jgi:flagellar hook-associated protein 2
MATTPTSSISGVVSGINYRDLIDQLMAVEKQPADRLRAQATQLGTQQTAMATFKGLLRTLQGSAKALRDGTAFSKLSATSSVAAGTRVLATATASTLATAASYQVEVTTLAQQQKLGSALQPGATVPAGVAGSFTLNGTTVSVVASDSLANIRDKINAVNSGTAASGVAASIITTGTGQVRLVLTSAKAGSAGMTLAETSGTPLQALGFLTGAAAIDPAAVLVAGQNADFSVDGVPFSTSSNVVSTAIEGVTLTLTSTEPGASTTVTVSRSASDAQAAMQAVVDGYNAVVDFIKQQLTAPASGAAAPPLLGDSLMRQSKAALPQSLLSSIAGASADLSTAAMAGLSLGQDGRLSLNSTKFNAAFTDRLFDLQKLFQQGGTSTGPSTSYLGSTSRTPAGTYPVSITQAATRSQVTGTGLGGAYADDGVGDTMTVTDTAYNRSASVTLTNGMTAAQITTALNTAFAAQGLGLLATTTGGEITLAQGAWGSDSGITVAYTGTSLGNVPIAADTYANGLDVTGTINGETATGNGQTLVAASGTKAQGLSVRYTGATTGDAGSVTINLGSGALIERLLQQYTDVNTGTVDSRTTGLVDRVKTLNDRADRIEGKLAVRRESLLRQYASMEEALGRLQSQSQSVVAVLNALTTNSGNG